MENIKSLKKTNFILLFPKRSVYSILILIPFTFFAVLQFKYFLIPVYMEIPKNELSINDIGFVWVPIISYILIAFFIIFLTRVFTKLSKFDDRDSLISRLFYNKSVGFCFVGGIFLAFVFSEGFSIDILIRSFTLGLTIGSILSLFFALIIMY